MNICIKCKHCKIESIPDTPCADVLCKKHYDINPIDGWKTYKDCSEINADGKCKDYEDNWYEKFKKKLKGE